MQTTLRIAGCIVRSEPAVDPPDVRGNRKGSSMRKAHNAPKPRYVGVASWYGADRQGKRWLTARNSTAEH